MAIQPDYVVGTVSINNGETTLVGVDTGWLSADIRPGDTLFKNGLVAVIDEVVDDTHIELTESWPGSELIDVPYRIRYQPDASRVTAQTRALIDLLNRNGFFQYNAAGTFAQRDDYDGRPKDFSFLRTDTFPAELYIKNSNDAGDWVGPFAYAQGEMGPPANLAIGDVITLAAGSPATADVTGIPPNFVLDFGIPQGIQGFKGDKGWSIEPQYILDDDRIVVRIASWIGGEGDQPIGAGLYIGATGFVTDINDAVDIRGAQGVQGPYGIVWHGDWDNAETYNPNDVVVDPDSADDPAAWISRTVNTNSKPRDNPTDWAYFPGSFPTNLDYGLITDMADHSHDYGSIV